MCFEHHNYLVVLYNFQQLAQEISKRTWKNNLKSLLSEESACLAVSEVFTKEHIKEILPQCLDAIRFNRQFYLGPILTYSDLGIFSSFIKENQLERLQQSIPQSCTKCQKKTRNYSLLSILFISNRNYKKTAEALFCIRKRFAIVSTKSSSCWRLI